MPGFLTASKASQEQVMTFILVFQGYTTSRRSRNDNDRDCIVPPCCIELLRQYVLQPQFHWNLFPTPPPPPPTPTNNPSRNTTAATATATATTSSTAFQLLAAQCPKSNDLIAIYELVIPTSTSSSHHHPLLMTTLELNCIRSTSTNRHVIHLQTQQLHSAIQGRHYMSHVEYHTQTLRFQKGVVGSKPKVDPSHDYKRKIPHVTTFQPKNVYDLIYNYWISPNRWIKDGYPIVLVRPDDDDDDDDHLGDEMVNPNSSNNTNNHNNNNSSRCYGSKKMMIQQTASNCTVHLCDTAKAKLQEGYTLLLIVGCDMVHVPLVHDETIVFAGMMWRDAATTPTTTTTTTTSTGNDGDTTTSTTRTIVSGDDVLHPQQQLAFIVVPEREYAVYDHSTTKFTKNMIHWEERHVYKYRWLPPPWHGYKRKKKKPKETWEGKKDTASQFWCVNVGCAWDWGVGELGRSPIFWLCVCECVFRVANVSWGVRMGERIDVVRESVCRYLIAFFGGWFSLEECVVLSERSSRKPCTPAVGTNLDQPKPRASVVVSLSARFGRDDSFLLALFLTLKKKVRVPPHLRGWYPGPMPPFLDISLATLQPMQSSATSISFQVFSTRSREMVEDCFPMGDTKP